MRILEKIEAVASIIIVVVLVLLSIVALHNYEHNESDTDVQHSLEQRVSNLERGCGK